jgi:hypothetical protein
MGIDHAAAGEEFVIAEPAFSPYAAGIGGWLEQLPDDVQANLYVLVICLSDPVARERLATSARKALRRMGHDIPSSTDIARRLPTAATRVAKHKKVSGR